MLTRLRLELPLTKDQMDEIVRLAIHYGYARVEPRVAWRQSERKEAARYAMERIISMKLRERLLPDGWVQGRAPLPPR